MQRLHSSICQIYVELFRASELVPGAALPFPGIISACTLLLLPQAWLASGRDSSLPPTQLAPFRSWENPHKILVKCMRSWDLVERIAQFCTKLCDLKSHDFEQNCVNLNPMNLARNYAIWIRAILCAIVLNETTQFCTKLCELKSHKSKRRIWRISLTLGKTH